MAEEKRLFYLLRNILLSSQIFCSYPFNELNQKENPNSTWVVYQATMMIAKDLIAVLVTKLTFRPNANKDLISIFIPLTRFVLSVLPTVNFITVLLKRGKMKEIIGNLIEVDSRLETLGYHPRYSLERKITYISSFLTILSILCFAYAVPIGLEVFCDVFHLTVALCAISAILRLITELISIVGQQFQFINANVSRPPCNISRVEFFIELHDKVSLISCMLKEIFTIQMLVISFTVFFHVTATIHFLVDQQAILFQFSTPGSLYTIMRVSFTSVHLIWGYRLVNLCVFTVKQSTEFTQILHMMMLEDETEKLCHNKKLYLHVAMKREVVFTACGLFNIDFSLVHSMVAAAATYLFILIQLSQK